MAARGVEFVGYVDGDPDDGTAAGIVAFLREHMPAGSWVVSAPEIVDQVDGEGTRTVGIAHLIRRPDIDTAAERLMLAEIRALTGLLARLSRDLRLTVAVGYDGETIGWIEDGIIDTTITEGLIDPWADRLS